MRKVLFALTITIFLSACSLHQNETMITENNQAPVTFHKEVTFVPPENIVLQSDKSYESLKKFPEVSIGETVKEENDMDSLLKNLRIKLAKTGIQVKEIQGQIDLIVPDTVAFGKNKIGMQGDFQNSLLEIVGLLNKYDEIMIQIIGYTDNIGSVLENQRKSLQKASLIASFLHEKGIAKERIITDGLGDEDPVANNATQTGREANRRIVITLISLK